MYSELVYLAVLIDLQLCPGGKDHVRGRAHGWGWKMTIWTSSSGKWMKFTEHAFHMIGLAWEQ